MTAPELALALDRPDAAFEPGGRLTGVASWTAAAPPRGLELRLTWACRGKGGRDLKIVQTVPLAAPRAAEQRPFALDLPSAPYSFQGTLISLSWTLELVALPGEEKARAELTIAPGGAPIVLESIPAR